MDTFLSTNGGVRASIGAINCDPVAASGITLDAGKSVPGEQAVTAGVRYAITATGDLGGHWLFSITGACSAAANIEWACSRGDTIVIKIPEGAEILYYLLQDESGQAYMRKLN